MTTICVDVMGSDKEPSVLLEGVAMALERDPELKVLVAGDASVVEPFARDHERASALATTEVIAMDEHPATAVRKKKDASIVRAAAAVRRLTRTHKKPNQSAARGIEKAGGALLHYAPVHGIINIIMGAYARMADSEV